MKRLLAIACFSILSFRALAQNPVEFQNVIPVGTVSPDAASLGKFGNIPVSYATGVPSVTIPLYEISVGHIKIPLSLDYHGGGVKVDEISSSVGLSWALNGIGTLSRNMVGIPDERQGGYTKAPNLDTLYNFFLGTAYGPTEDNYLAKYYLNVRDNIAETEQDVFSYSTLGSSGKFLYRQNGTILQIPITNNKIENVGSNFKITDDKGTIFIYDQIEQANMIGQTGVGWYTNGWRLSKIIDPSMADTVFINYDAHNGDIERTWHFTYSFGVMCDQYGTGLATKDITGEKSSVSQIGHYNLYPKEIIWRGGKVVLKNVFDRTDRTNEARLDSVLVYSKLNGVYTLVKQIKLHQSYFYSNPITGATADNRNYRLRLDSVSFVSLKPSDPPQRYRMTYNNTPIAPNESFGQDIWGFNNGQFNNSSLMPIQSILWQGIYHTVGEARMDPDSTNIYVQACMLQSIQYPTKGESVFEFEPHRYLQYFTTNQLVTLGCDAFGSVQQTSQQTFTVDSSMTAVRDSVFLTKYAGTNTTDYPRVTIVDQTTGTEIFRATNMTPYSDYSTPTAALNVVAGHTYVVTVSIFTTDPNARGSAVISWEKPIQGSKIKIGGGLRVKSVTNYDNNSNFINKELYDYGPYGTLITPANYLLVNYEDQFSRCSIQSEASPTGCIVWGTDNVPARIYHQNSIYPASQFSGSVVAYGGVTKYEVDANGVSNGKSLYQYNIYEDNSNYAGTNYGTIGILLTNNTWKSGFLRRESIYKSTASGYAPLSIKEYNYATYRADSFSGLKIKVLCQNSGDCGVVDSTYARTGGPGISYFFPYRIPNNTGAILLQSESDTTFDSSGNKVVTVHNNYYDDLTHIFPTRNETFNSKGDNLVNVIKYPHDLAATGNVYQTMLNRNMVSPIVRFIQRKNSMQLDSTNINYNDWYGNGTLLLEKSVDANTLSTPMERRLNLDKYDQYGNILQQEKAKAPNQSYQWGYYGQYPVAKVANAPVNDIFYDSFEEGDGTSSLNDSKTGHYSFSGSYSKSLNGLDAGTYTLSYWSKTGSIWTWNFVNNISVTGSAYNIALSGQIDDVRFYPSNAQMSTYTYDPLIGMTSATDVKGEITYYEYDGFQRLVTIRDKDKNVLKHFDYHYQTSMFIPK